MSSKIKYENRILEIDKELAEYPYDAALYIERGKLYNNLGEMDKALNDFIKAREYDPQNAEAGELIDMISEIFEYRYKDIYNP